MSRELNVISYREYRKARLAAAAHPNHESFCLVLTENLVNNCFGIGESKRAERPVATPKR